MFPTLLASVLVAMPAQAPSVKFGNNPTTAIQSAGRTNGLVMVYFSQSGCPACRRMAETTFRDPQVIRLVQPLNPQAVDTSTAYGAAYSQRYGVSKIPKALFINSGGRVVGAIEGYHTPPVFAARVTQIQRWHR